MGSDRDPVCRIIASLMLLIYCPDQIFLDLLFTLFLKCGPYQTLVCSCISPEFMTNVHNFVSFPLLFLALYCTALSAVFTGTKIMHVTESHMFNVFCGAFSFTAAPSSAEL